VVGPLDAETGRDVMRAGNGEDIAEAGTAQCQGEVRVAAVGFVAGDPSTRQATGQRGFDQPACQLWFRGEADGVGHCCLSASLLVLGPGFRQAESDIEQGVPGRRRIGQVDRELAVLDLPGGSGVLPLHPDGVGAICRANGYAAPAADVV
jgi:hypothetical protein